MISYALANILSMKPGSLIGGFVHSPGGWGLGPAWVLQPKDINLKRPNIYSSFPITEQKVRWRQRFRDVTRKVSASFLLSPNLTDLEHTWKNSRNTVKIGFDTTVPVGIYLGYFLRCNGISLVNILTLEGYDVWI